MTRILLDTSAYSAFRRGHPGIVAHVAEASAVFLNPVIIGELRSGFLAGNRREPNERELDQFLSESVVGVLPIVEATARRYSLIRHYLRRQGTPIPSNDMWIAASAFEHGLDLVTLDRHFKQLPQVVVDHFEL